VAIERFSPRLVINVGVAGGLGGLKPFDIVLPEFAVEHDMDTSALGDEVGYLSDLKLVRMQLSGGDIEKIKRATQKPLTGGVLASGDVFVAADELKRKLVDVFGATCCDMEGGAIAHACAVFGVPCVVLRTISDSGDGCDFMQFALLAATQCAELLEEVVVAL